MIRLRCLVCGKVLSKLGRLMLKGLNQRRDRVQEKQLNPPGRKSQSSEGAVLRTCLWARGIHAFQRRRGEWWHRGEVETSLTQIQQFKTQTRPASNARVVIRLKARDRRFNPSTADMVNRWVSAQLDLTRSTKREWAHLHGKHVLLPGLCHMIQVKKLFHSSRFPAAPVNNGTKPKRKEDWNQAQRQVVQHIDDTQGWKTRKEGCLYHFT